MKKKILVTGANGQLGLTFKELFEKNSKTCEFTFMSKANLDISNTDDLKRVFESDKYDYCINCAAYTNVDQAEIEQEINRAKEELRSKVAGLALAGAEKILEASLDDEANRALVDKLATQL